MTNSRIQSIIAAITAVALIAIPSNRNPLIARVIHFSPPVYLDTSANRFPTITRYEADILLYAQSAVDSVVILQGYRISTMGDLPVLDTFTVLPTDRKPYRPTLYSLDSQRVLLWYEDVTHYDPAVPADTTFRVNVVKFGAVSPTEDELLKEQFVVYSPRSYEYRPTFVQIGDYLYFDVLRWLYPDYYEQGHRVKLRRMNLTSGTLDSQQYEYSTDGKLGLLVANDTLLLTRSWFNCIESTGPNFDVCLRWRGGYSIDYFSDFESAGGSILFLGDGNINSWASVDANTRAWSDLNGSLFLTTLPKIAYTLTANSLVPQERIDLFPYTQTFGVGSDLHPARVGEYNCFLAISANHSTAGLILFDREWNFVESSDISLLGIPLEFSEIIPLNETSELIFAYATQLSESNSSSRVVLQKVRLDITTSVEDQISILPEDYSLRQNRPNPFNPSTKIQFSIPYRSAVEMDIFNIIGQKVTTLIEGELSAGTYNVEWNGRTSSGVTVSSGIYIYQFSADGFTESKKMLLLR